MGKKAKSPSLSDDVSEYSSYQTTPKSKRNIHKRPWTQDEDNLLIRLVQEFGPQKWSLIAKQIPLRQGKQCRERWFNHLNPIICKSDWNMN